MRLTRRVLAILTLSFALIPAHGAARAAPPTLVLDLAQGTGSIVRHPGGSIEIVTVPILDTSPRDTVPSRARLEFRWHAEPEAEVAGYHYKLNEPAFVKVDSSVHSVTYNTGIGGDVVGPGIKVFTLRVYNDEGEYSEITRRFQLNYAPDTWFAGPDLAVLDARFGWTDPNRSLAIADWNALPDLSGSGLSCDSLTRRPSERAEHRTFLEIYGNRLYVRSEFDTVHANSWVVFHGGGFDRDSPYDIVVEPGDPALQDTVDCAEAGPPWVVRDDGVIGSPVGFRSQYSTALYPSGFPSVTPRSNLYPMFDPGSVFYFPMIGAYSLVTMAGEAYYVLQSEDADGTRDRRIADGMALARRVDAGLGTPEEVALRSKIIAFHVNRDPFFRLDDPGFVPVPGQEFARRTLELHLLAEDEDPWVPGTPPGGPAANQVLRRRVSIAGKTAAGTDSTIALLGGASFFTPDVTVDVPEALVGRDVLLIFDMCDAVDPENQPGSGRCVTRSIPVRVPSGATAAAATLIASEVSPGRVWLRWQLAESSLPRVERKSPDTDWEDRGEAIPERGGADRVGFEDRSVTAGARYGYRLVLAAGPAGQSWIDVPGAALALEGIRPNPSSGRALEVHFTLARAGTVRLELLDVSGRRVVEKAVEGLGGGPHAVVLEPGRSMAAGVYVVRLIQGADARTARAMIIR